ncbi:MAG: TetR/AcrR family transcriptional regulator [Solirubrobacterales bacterium]
MARDGGKGEGEKLRRLPPGRHGLSREFVAQNQRERLIAGSIAAVAERGFRETTVTEISAAAGVSRRTFYAYFQTKDECFLATFDLLEGHLFAAIAEAAPAKASWTEQVRARVAAMLGLFGENPDLVRFALVAPPAAGGPVMERNRRLLERLVGELAAGAPRGRGSAEPTEVEREATAGAIAAVLASKVEAGSDERLGEASPELVELVLVPFVGRRRAATAAAKPQSR